MEDTCIVRIVGDDEFAEALNDGLPDEMSTQTVKSLSLATYAVGGEEYPLVSKARCKVCQSANRYQIELAVVRGAGFQAAADSYGEGQINDRNVRTHFENGHLPITDVALAKVKKKQRLRYSEMIEAGANAMCGTLGKAQILVDQATLRLIEDEMTPTFHEGLQAAKLIARAEETAAKSRLLTARTVVETLMSIAERELAPSEVQRLRHAIHQDPSLSELGTPPGILP